ncbi:MAG: hypothetical protein IPH08_20050 [Rhodocyclaceae bacterium]|nr:hypothetical protein [Rhodocyclaceae bacterium]
MIAVLATALRNYQEMQRVELASRAANLAVVAADAAWLLPVPSTGRIMPSSYCVIAPT